ncbi:GNAT family N-acetyltransferase [Tenacibaculum finnmarkense genomovar finnmarkense]|uniref:GNAT family N-acetyltransferase n=1 Tax=Tenacibaculum finnmarkense TaxID=2781243 RepID=UPI001E4B7EB8|nr:GNAT family N-acetyltransferase [Tenacibaculum finnmarkense]MCD8418041.1 GNAT family N-acetyltransferase [Tenacibaculum finnmarkense genomovar finnmarkense]MCG8186428.1 GNAT family N-acetyltransferase [Tenacibaculum finnmarkense genomovar finnmarkense]MCG8202841.1 GNAT family N-acetyltransferase [Tenacibaculum finnmarkense genomovar finnmarkense]MCG8210229.1 GNAT family N-acetyltransferase [Tenacibaculum finnmarkense genomovar finnmarkense]MCG8213122.1 GNAT family N-acetyltransferase [Tenac
MNFKIKRLKNIYDTYFSEAWKLYQEAFPVEERRLLETQINILKNSIYHFDVILHQNKFIGFLLWWNFETLNFIDHFATVSAHRNKGFGKKIIENFIKNNQKLVLLEVELPDTEINKRRIQFYERVGFHLNSHYYETPDLSNNEKVFQLLLMSYPKELTFKNIEQFTTIYQPIVFNQ